MKELFTVLTLCFVCCLYEGQGAPCEFPCRWLEAGTFGNYHNGTDYFGNWKFYPEYPYLLEVFGVLNLTREAFVDQFMILKYSDSPELTLYYCLGVYPETGGQYTEFQIVGNYGYANKDICAICYQNVATSILRDLSGGPPSNVELVQPECLTPQNCTTCPSGNCDICTPEESFELDFKCRGVSQNPGIPSWLNISNGPPYRLF